MSNQSQNDSPLTVSRAPKFNFTIGLLLIVMTVIAASGISLGYYAKALYAVSNETDRMELGIFAIVAAMTPTVFLVGASCFLKLTGWFLKIIKS